MLGKSLRVVNYSVLAPGPFQSHSVVPAKAGTQSVSVHSGLWIPAFAGMTNRRRKGSHDDFEKALAWHRLPFMPELENVAGLTFLQAPSQR